MKIRKFVAVILLITTLVCALSSCTRMGAAIALSNAYPDKDEKFTFKTTMEFSSEGSTMPPQYAMLEAMVLTAYVDGDKLEMVTSTSYEGASVVVTQTIVDNYIYVKNSVTYGGVSAGITIKKAELTAEQREELVGGANSIAIGIGDFETITKEKKDGLVIYTLAGFKDDSESGLEDLVKSVHSSSAKISVRDIVFNIELKDGKVHREIVSCTYHIEENRLEYDINMVMTNVYGGEAKEVEVPFDAGIWELVPYDQVNG